MEMKIYLLVLLFSFYSMTSATWWLTYDVDETTTKKSPGTTRTPPTTTTTTPSPRDCVWQETWTVAGLCVEVKGKHFNRGRLEVRGKIPEKHGGKPCVGVGTRITECPENDYYAHLFHRTVVAVVSGGSGTARRTIIGGSKKCSAPITDSNGTVVAAGRNCPKGTRKKRRVVDSLKEMQRRAKRQAPPILSTKNRDVLFLLDESGSVGSSNYKLVIRMAKALVQSFCGIIGISKSQTRVGVLGFNREQHPAINFDEYFDKATLLSQMDAKIKYYGYPSAGATCLVDALEFTRKDMFTVARGARMGAAGTERIVILITDGCANCKNANKLEENLNDMGSKFTQDGVPIITFLIADKPGHCFKIMKGLADGSQCYQQFWVKDWNVFTSRIEAIENAPCMDAWMIGPSC